MSHIQPISVKTTKLFKLFNYLLVGLHKQSHSSLLKSDNQFSFINGPEGDGTKQKSYGRVKNVSLALSGRI